MTGSARRLVLAGILGLALPDAAPAQDAAPPTPAPAEAASAPARAEPYVRMQEDEGGVLRLEMASRSFTPASGAGPTLHLVSAVHLADASFYAGLQKHLDAMDLVLFEGIKPSGSAALEAGATDAERAEATRRRLDLLKVMAGQQRAEGGSYPADLAASRDILTEILTDGWGHPFRYRRRTAGEGGEGSAEAAQFSSDGSDGRPDPVDAAAAGDDLRIEAVAGKDAAEPSAWSLYAEVARALGLTYQADGIDTGGPKWRSCDISLDELQRKIEDAGGDVNGLLALLQGSSPLGKMASVVLRGMTANSRMAVTMKMAMVEGLAAASADGPTREDAAGLGMVVRNPEAVMRVILEGRNAVVVKDLRSVLAKEPGLKSVAVFYGAGHMGGLEKGIVEGLGYRPAATTWTTAIRVDPAEAGLTPEQAKAMRESFRRMKAGMKPPGDGGK
jgi:hypothetical protein